MAVTSQKKRRYAIIAICIVFLALLVLAFLSLSRNPAASPSPFTKGSVDFKVACQKDCKTLADFAPGHNGDDESTPLFKTKMQYLPKADDDIAQWGDCLDSVMICWEGALKSDAAGARRNGDKLSGCVARSACPATCKQKFQSGASTEFKVTEKLFLEMFVDDGGYCTPRPGGGTAK